jgi:flagellar FliJ protein
MKRFRFALERVMEWRRLQAQIEQSALERLHAELRELAERAEQVKTDRERAGRDLIRAGSAAAVELAFLDSFRKAADAELARLAGVENHCRGRIQSQAAKVADRRRDVRMLEKLKERKLAEWERDSAREVDQQAGEIHLTLLARR